jgi:adenylate cyclase class 2
LPAETEAKVVLGDCGLLGVVEERLRSLGARLLEEKREEDTYYQHPCRDFAETDEALRLRLAAGRAELTYKGPKRIVGGAKTRLEETVAVGDPEAAHRILEALGFRPVAKVVKTRRYYRLGDVLVTLDRVEGLGCFLEAEYAGPSSDPEEAARAIEEALRSLGADRYPRTAKSYLELLLEARGGRG